MRWWWHRGYGFGRGWGFGGFGAPWCPWSYWNWGRRWLGRGAWYYPYGLAKEEEKELLEEWKKDLEADLEDIKRRLEELK